MGFKHRAAAIIYFVILLSTVIQGGQSSLPAASPSSSDKTGVVFSKTTTAFSEQATAGAVAGRTLSSEGENVLLLLLGLVLLFVFTAIKLWPSGNNKERAGEMPSKTD
ncbi:MAG TPA: hypothetical protein PLD20_24720 [Blastocatellia bacterium]|nr:hypothetical protein [Blastocatellia bacterium]HMV84824.1 hypothetical protein [Blastocatellia bacterium]HMX26266.1 hypothetical protein [Blastocatellia bacterium]HMZ21161.1 hypothetical protein [Blastocatellia bacterium]HNG31742.1 hypothetical protein [Blastocatellia bacterium]